MLNQTERNTILQNIYFKSRGEGPAVILLHGFCESHAIFDGLIDALSQNYRVICPDLPGHGGTPWDQGMRSMDEAAFWLRDLMDALALEQVCLVGHSMGGYIAAAFATFFPERLNALGMLHTTALADTETRKRNRSKAIQFIEKNGVAPFLEVFVQSLFHTPQPEWIALMEEITAKTNPDAVLAFTQIMRDRPDRSEVIRGLEIPVMYITGAKDALVSPERSAEELQHMPLAILKRMPEASHMGMFEAKDKVLDALNSLMELGG